MASSWNCEEWLWVEVCLFLHLLGMVKSPENNYSTLLWKWISGVWYITILEWSSGDFIIHRKLQNLIFTFLGVSDKWPKSKYQNFKRTQWFSYKIWTKNSEEPIVYLHNWPLPEQHHFLKIQWEILFLTFLNTGRNAKKKFRIEIWTFSFKICF